jgi:hypothetical protein
MFFCVVTSCRSEGARIFRIKHRLQLQVQKVSQARNGLSSLPDSACLFFDLLTKVECRGDMFLRNVRLSPNSMDICPEDSTFHSHRLENLRVKTDVPYSSLHLPISSSEDFPFLYSVEDLIDRVIKRKPCFGGASQFVSWMTWSLCITGQTPIYLRLQSLPTPPNPKALRSFIRSTSQLIRLLRFSHEKAFLVCRGRQGVPRSNPDKTQ